jgi:hypothetical protein
MARCERERWSQIVVTRRESWVTTTAPTRAARGDLNMVATVPYRPVGRDHRRPEGGGRLPCGL